MWTAYLKLKMYHRRPSDDLEVTDSIAAYCLDGCVLTWGIVIENALAETVEIGWGSNKKREDKYTLSELLDPVFLLPKPRPEPRRIVNVKNGLEQLVAMASTPRSGVKQWTYKPN